MPSLPPHLCWYNFALVGSCICIGSCLFFLPLPVLPLLSLFLVLFIGWATHWGAVSFDTPGEFSLLLSTIFLYFYGVLLKIVSNFCSWYILLSPRAVGKFPVSAVVNYLSAWTNASSGITVGFATSLCLENTISDTLFDILSFAHTV